MLTGKTCIVNIKNLVFLTKIELQKSILFKTTTYSFTLTLIGLHHLKPQTMRTISRVRTSASFDQIKQALIQVWFTKKKRLKCAKSVSLSHKLVLKVKHYSDQTIKSMTDKQNEILIACKDMKRIITRITIKGRERVIQGQIYGVTNTILWMVRTHYSLSFLACLFTCFSFQFFWCYF